jgi:hypothetical protein
MTVPMTAAGLAALVGLGAFHGLNPGMGWLFAVAIGMQEHSRRALYAALPPIAAGHAASVLLVALMVTASQSVVTTRVVAIGGGAVLVGFGLWRMLSQRHFRWAGMRLSPWQLASWSFLMSSVHGAGLMLLPVLVGTMHSGHGHMHHGDLAGAMQVGAWNAVVATAVHTLAMVTVAGVVAVAVYEVFGLRILRTAWVNVDRVWAVALVGAGVATVVLSS